MGAGGQRPMVGGPRRSQSIGARIAVESSGSAPACPASHRTSLHHTSDPSSASSPLCLYLHKSSFSFIFSEEGANELAAHGALRILWSPAIGESPDPHIRFYAAMTIANMLKAGAEFPPFHIPSTIRTEHALLTIPAWCNRPADAGSAAVRGVERLP
jgi:hypothetical protein